MYKRQLFDKTPESVLPAEIQSVINMQGELELNSTLLSGSRFSALRDGSTPSTQRALWSTFAGTGSHSHADLLNLGLIMYGKDIMPDTGYPKVVDGTNKVTNEWMRNTISHNTCLLYTSNQIRRNYLWQ